MNEMEQWDLDDRLLMAILMEHLDNVSEFLGAGANVNAKCLSGRPLLNYAADKGIVNTVEILLEKGANVNAKDDYGFTPLHVAAYGGHLNVVKTLLKAEAKVDAKNIAGETALLIASSKGDVEIAKALIKHTVLRSPETEKPDYIVNDAALSEYWDNKVKALGESKEIASMISNTDVQSFIISTQR